MQEMINEYDLQDILKVYSESNQKLLFYIKKTYTYIIMAAAFMKIYQNM